MQNYYFFNPLICHLYKLEDTSGLMFTLKSFYEKCFYVIKVSIKIWITKPSDVLN